MMTHGMWPLIKEGFNLWCSLAPENMPALLDPVQCRLTQRVKWDDQRGGAGELRIIYPDILNKDICLAKQTDG